MRGHRSFAILLVAIWAAALAHPAGGAQREVRPARGAVAKSEVLPPQEPGSVRLAIIGDSGTGDREQYEVAAQLTMALEVFPYEFVIMLGDNIYGRERPQDFVKKFEVPYAGILGRKIPFYASLGNHDDAAKQTVYPLFNMNGERYYTYAKGNARFFALDSNRMDAAQIAWLTAQLARATERWKVAYFHHPIYSSGDRHGSELNLRARVEPLFVKYGVDAVFAGHEHFYERIRPQNGIYHFTQGGAAKLRRDNIQRGPLTAAGFDTDRSYMLAELGADTLYFQVLSRLGQRVDTGSVQRDPGN